MNRRTLNGLDPRSVKEATRDPYDWSDESVRSAILGGSFPGMRRRRKPRTQRTDRSLRGRILRTVAALWRWLNRASPWSRT